ncbi:MAG: hypothetical protein NTY13_06345 [Chlamydiae bacterium]|nr:hypothetical protein [Chlamydiota bacterium]
MQPNSDLEKKKEVLLTFATEKEAFPTIALLKAIQIEPSFWNFSKGSLLITGIGSLQAALSIMPLCHLFEEIWNIGIAGSLTGEEGLHIIGSIEKLTFMPETTSSYSRNFFQQQPIFLGPGKKLVTSDFPIHDKNLKIRGDLIDMEGYGIALACQKMQRKLKMWKIVSDFAAPGGEKEIQEKIETLSWEIALFIQEKL